MKNNIEELLNSKKLDKHFLMPKELKLCLNHKKILELPKKLQEKQKKLSLNLKLIRKLLKNIENNLKKIFAKRIKKMKWPNKL